MSRTVEPPEGWRAYWKNKVANDLAGAQTTHAWICARLDGTLLKVAQHHHPIPGSKSLYCDGCDLEWEDAIGAWPCPTWKLIEDGVTGSGTN
jgi:hypothetical protein